MEKRARPVQKKVATASLNVSLNRVALLSIAQVIKNRQDALQPLSKQLQDFIMAPLSTLKKLKTDVASLCGYMGASLFCGLFLIAQSQAGDFLSVLPDVPLPANVIEIADSQIDFDSPDGRIIQVSAQGAMTKKAILDFYEETMPELGWEAISSNEFLREKERLTLEFSSQNQHIFIQFELSPVTQ